MEAHCQKAPHHRQDHLSLGGECHIF